MPIPFFTLRPLFGATPPPLSLRNIRDPRSFRLNPRMRVCSPDKQLHIASRDLAVWVREEGLDKLRSRYGQDADIEIVMEEGPAEVIRSRLIDDAEVFNTLFEPTHPLVAIPRSCNFQLPRSIDVQSLPIPERLNFKGPLAFDLNDDKIVVKRFEILRKNNLILVELEADWGLQGTWERSGAARAADDLECYRTNEGPSRHKASGREGPPCALGISLTSLEPRSVRLCGYWMENDQKHYFGGTLKAADPFSPDARNVTD